MKRTFYKTLSCGLLMVIMLACSLLLAGCDKSSASKIMNLSLNPSIEFVLDGNNRVLTVNGNNNEGNFIIANAEFVGISAEEAVKLFIEINYENGFIKKGGAGTGENRMSIDISGDDGKQLFKRIKETADNCLSNLDARMEIDFYEISRAEIEDLVESFISDYSHDKIIDMTEKQLINLIEKSRKETEDMLQEELKALYYQTRADELVKIKFEVVMEELSSVLSIPGFDKNEVINVFNAGIVDIIKSMNDFKLLFKQSFIDAQSDYQIAMKQYLEAKKTLLEARIEEIADTSEIEEALSLAEEVLANVGENCMYELLAIETQINDLIENLNLTLNSIIRFLNQDKINNAIEEAKKDFNQKFKLEFREYIENDYWQEFKPNFV